MNAVELLHQLKQEGFELNLKEDGSLGIKPASRLTDALRGYIKMHKNEMVSELKKSSSMGHSTPVQPDEFHSDASEDVVPTPHDQPIYRELVDAIPPTKALETLPDWEGLIIKSAVLGLSVWVVRDTVYGIALAKETGHPAILLDDVIRLKGATQDEARAALLPLLIMAQQ